MTSLATGQTTSQSGFAQESGSHARHGESREINVGSNERTYSLIGGGALMLLGVARGSLGGLALAAAGGMLAYRGATGHCSLYQALGRNSAEKDTGAEPEDYSRRGIHVETAVTINRPAEELFRFWRDFTNLPQFMKHLKSVEVLDEKRSRWVAKAPAGMNVQWDAEIINEEPNSLIAWRSVGGADVDNAGSVRFLPAPGDRGTEVRVVIDYIPPAGRVGSFIAKLFGREPQQQIRGDVRRFKQLMEAGELPTTDGQPKGTCSGGGKRHHGI